MKIAIPEHIAGGTAQRLFESEGIQVDGIQYPARPGRRLVIRAGFEDAAREIADYWDWDIIEEDES